MMKQLIIALALCLGIGSVTASGTVGKRPGFLNRWDAPQKLLSSAGVVGGAVGTGVFSHKAIQHKKEMNRIDRELKKDPNNQQLKSQRAHHKKMRIMYALLATGSSVGAFVALLIFGAGANSAHVSMYPDCLDGNERAKKTHEAFPANQLLADTTSPEEKVSMRWMSKNMTWNARLKTDLKQFEEIRTYLSSLNRPELQAAFVKERVLPEGTTCNNEFCIKVFKKVKSDFDEIQEGFGEEE